MNKVINGKMYNTETADFLGRVSLGTPRNWDYQEEELYKKKNGEYFFCFVGPTFSRCLAWVYQEFSGTGGHQRFRPTSERLAKQWIEENFDGDKYVELFGEVEE